MLDLCPITIFTTTTTMSRAALKEAQAKIKQLEDEKEDLAECNDILTFNMELFKKEASQLKLQNLELRETLNNKFRRTTKKEEEGEIQLPPMPDATIESDTKVAELESTILQLQVDIESWKSKYDESAAVNESLETKVRAMQEQVDALTAAWSLHRDSSASRAAGAGRVRADHFESTF
ncbi:hypothetical protein CPB85DRAFT_841679 [Mucidula mucida]|nr:hypothetical protein CPB85DRAFT_841679 [Mucidula mucida]